MAVSNSLPSTDRVYQTAVPTPAAAATLEPSDTAAPLVTSGRDVRRSEVTVLGRPGCGVAGRSTGWPAKRRRTARQLTTWLGSHGGCPTDGVYRVAVAIRGVLLDLEGTLYSREQPIPGAAEAVLAIRKLGLGLRFLTNIDSKPGVQILDGLAEYGLAIQPEELFTPVVAAESLLSAVPDARVYALVSKRLRGSISGAADEPPFTHVLVGDCADTLDYSRLDEAFRALRSGAGLVALQRGRYFKGADGDHLDTGAVVAALEYAAGLQARVLGKPSPDFFGLAATALGVDVTECVVVGDDATTDIAGGRAVGALTVQVRTGKYADQQAEGHPRAEHVLPSVAALPALLERLSPRGSGRSGPRGREA